LKDAAMGKTLQAVMDTFPRLREIADPGLREKVCRAWLAAWQASGYAHLEDASQWEPAREALGISNVAHTNGVVECALALAEALRQSQALDVDRDVLIAAAVLHDLDKIRLFHAADGRPTELGRRIGHVLTGVHLALAADLPVAVAHAIAAHSPTYSTVAPQTPEAVILKHADKVFTDLWILQRGRDVDFSI
jgi:7,8-dihydroneopterin 2',3'-cyclic phosphate phosphodiesterase